MNSIALLEELKTMVTAHRKRAAQLSRLPESTLQYRPTQKSWNAVECIAHLNLYGTFYIPEITQCIHKSKHATEETFCPGRLGNKAAMYMLPQNGDFKKMNTFQSKNTFGLNHGNESFKIFDEQQHALLKLLDKAAAVSLTRTKTKLTLPLLKFRLGDTLRFVIYHNERHLQQAERATNHGIYPNK